MKDNAHSGADGGGTRLAWTSCRRDKLWRGQVWRGQVVAGTSYAMDKLSPGQVVAWTSRAVDKLDVTSLDVTSCRRDKSCHGQVVP